MGLMDTLKSPRSSANRKQVNGSKADDHKDDDGKMKFDLNKLPSEKDRKAILGCLSQVLAMMYSYENNADDEASVKQEMRRFSSSSRSSNSKQDEKKEAGAKSAPQGTQDGNSESNTNSGTAQSPSLSGSGSAGLMLASPSRQPSRSSATSPIGADSLSRSRHESKSKLSSAQHECRVGVFQRRCLKRASNLLLLDEKHATGFESAFENDRIGYMDSTAQVNYIAPYLDSLSDAGAGFQCLTMLLFRSLLESRSNQKDGNGNPKDAADDDLRVVGYDARIRRAFKILAHLILSRQYEQTQQLQQADCDDSSSQQQQQLSAEELNHMTARKFEALESDISKRMVAVADAQAKAEKEEKEHQSGNGIQQRERQMSTKDKWIRGMKVGGVGLAAGTLFAITGGLAAPAIAAGITSLAGGTVLATMAVFALQSVAAVTTIFGVGGGGLAAVKMMKRTAGLEEFDILNKTDPQYQAQLSRTVCISGWIKDPYDFQRPWGIMPDNLMNPKELLVKFYSVYDPKMVPEANRVLEQYFGKRSELWQGLRDQYGADPYTILPLRGPRQEAMLNDTETKWVVQLVEGLGFSNFPDYKPETEAVKVVLSNDGSKEEADAKLEQAKTRTPPPQPPILPVPKKEDNETSDQQWERQMAAWDFQATYSGELYTVKWETELLLRIHDPVKDVARNMASDATKEALKQTILAGILVAVALPVGLVRLCNTIDGNWTMTLERADEAGKELAVSLLESKAGHRPVTLVAYSFGARIVYSCLMELARHQELWEAQQEEQKSQSKGEKQLRQMSRQMTLQSSSSAIDINNYKPAEYKREPASIVEDAILMGSPISLSLQEWLSCRRIVAGRLINCYVPNDLMLRLMFRYQHITSIFRAPCGVVPVKVPGVENFNVTEFVSWHSDYCSAMRAIMDMIGFGQAKVAPREEVTEGEDVDVQDMLPSETQEVAKEIDGKDIDISEQFEPHGSSFIDE
jgi:hypothetical protein